MKLTKEELAARLNGREYLEEMGKDDIAISYFVGELSLLNLI